MNYYELGAGAVLGAGIFGSIAYLYIRLLRVESQLIQARQKNVDNAIVEKTRLLSDDELNSLVGKNLGSGNPKT